MKSINAKLEDLVRTIKCSKNFVCIRSRFTKLCKASDIGLKCNLLCLDGACAECDYQMSVDLGHFCQCPVRIYIGKMLKL